MTSSRQGGRFSATGLVRFGQRPRLPLGERGKCRAHRSRARPTSARGAAHPSNAFPRSGWRSVCRRGNKGRSRPPRSSRHVLAFASSPESPSRASRVWAGIRRFVAGQGRSSVWMKNGTGGFTITSARPSRPRHAQRTNAKRAVPSWTPPSLCSGRGTASTTRRRSATQDRPSRHDRRPRRTTRSRRASSSSRRPWSRSSRPNRPAPA